MATYNYNSHIIPGVRTPYQFVMKSQIRNLIESGIANFGKHRWRHREGSLLILTYHRILPPSDPGYRFEQPGMVVHPDTFEMHLHTLREFFDIVSLPDWINKARKGEHLPNKACAITFDDGWRDNYQYAYPVLQATQTPTSIFLVSNFIGKPDDFWPGQLAHILEIASQHADRLDWQDESLIWLRTLMGNPAKVPPYSTEWADHCIMQAKAFPDSDIYEKLTVIRKIPPFDALTDTRVLLNQEEINTMGQSGLISYGSHTCNHTRLSNDLAVDVLQKEIVHSRDALQTKTQQDINLFCYPNGDTCTAATPLIVDTYYGACTTQRGWNHASNKLWGLKRISMHNDVTNTRTKFLAKLSGWY